MKIIESPVLLIFEIRNREKEDRFKRLNEEFNFSTLEHSEGVSSRNIFH